MGALVEIAKRQRKTPMIDLLKTSIGVSLLSIRITSFEYIP
jgi:hypothetical protein